MANERFAFALRRRLRGTKVKNGCMAENPPTTRASQGRANFSVQASRQFVSWLATQQTSIAFTTYQGGKLFFLGLGDEGGISGFERTFQRAMGLAGDQRTLWLGSRYQLWRLENVLADGEHAEGYDRLYVPMRGYTTGDLDIHDVAVEADGRPVFISARFSCLATVSERYHFTPLWTPPFITRLAAEDRCHLNGVAVADGHARYATACSRTDVVEGWRDHRHDGGCVLDIERDEVIAEGLSMPHSPLVYRDQLWLLDSGSGFFGYVDRQSGRFERMTFCPGYCRGLSFIGDYAVVGLSLPRRDSAFEGLELEENLRRHGVSARCGLVVIELATGDVVHSVRLEGPVRELYEMLALPGVRRPKALGFKTDEICTRIWVDPEGATR